MHEKVSQLTLTPRVHELLGRRAAARWAADRPMPVLQVLDFLVDGVSLLDMIRARLPGFLLVSPLWVSSPLAVEFHATALLGEGPSDLHEGDPEGHVALFMCPHCAIGGCGVLSARLTRDDDRVVWTDVAQGRPNLAGIGPFVFKADEYERALRPLTLNRTAGMTGKTSVPGAP
ncbi:hypothetical protein [Micromonospora sp. NBC_01412]|uniref:hypothetical protein n=1 Tax=Micromonospora sp. NBC_01412 TaxID=2903590 RepID=UPI003244AF63